MKTVNETYSLQPIVDHLRARIDGAADPARNPRTAIVLGSGLGHLSKTIANRTVIPYAEIPGHPGTTVAGHSGEWIVGTLGETPVLLQSGRFHLYEGHDPSHVILPVRAMAALGIERLVLTNAAGCLRPAWNPPALMLLDDHVNFSFRSPLRGATHGDEPRFPDMACPYDEELRAVARKVALDAGIQLFEGTYVAMMGPSYETPAEVRMLDRLGADAVGMSTAPEAIAAAACGIRTVAISTLTNLGAGISPTKLDHQEVLEAGEAVKESLETVVRGIVASPLGSG